MDTYLKDYLKLSSYGEFIGEILFPSFVKNENINIKSKTVAIPLRGLGRYRAKYTIINESTALDALRMSNPAPIRGLGRVGSFYKTLAQKRKNEIFTISEKKYNYWRGAGRKNAQTESHKVANS